MPNLCQRNPAYTSVLVTISFATPMLLSYTTVGQGLKLRHKRQFLPLTRDVKTIADQYAEQFPPLTPDVSTSADRYTTMNHSLPETRGQSV